MFKIISTCKGGGYRYARTDPPHPRANSNGLYPLHRVLMENKVGRLLEPWEHVHHKDEDKSNDDPDNLEIKTAVAHGRHHRPARPLVEVICQCGTAFHVKEHVKRQRESRAKGLLSCSRACATRYARIRAEGKG